jgi:STAS-like domain of unknown function (DUF4325)
MELKLAKYGQIISDDELGKKIADEISSLLKKNIKIIIDFSGVQSMVTYNAKQIFGELYLELGSEDFFKRIQLKNISSNLEYIIRLGIQDSINSREEEYA